MWSGPLTMTSVIVGSLSSGSSGPKPVISSSISWTRRSRSSRLTAKLLPWMTRSTMPSTLVRVSFGVPSRSVSNARMTSPCIPTRISWSIPSRAAVRGVAGVLPPAGVVGMSAGTNVPAGAWSTGGPADSGARGASDGVVAVRWISAALFFSCRSSSDMDSLTPAYVRDSLSENTPRSGVAHPHLRLVLAAVRRPREAVGILRLPMGL